MKTSKGLIGFLSGLFSLIHVGMMAMAVFVFITLILNFVSEDKFVAFSEDYTIISKGDIPKDSIDISAMLSKDYHLSYSLGTEINSNKIHKDKLETLKIVDNSLRGKILGSIHMILLYVLGLILAKELASIFNSLDNSIKNKIWFQIGIYHSLKKLAYLTAGLFCVKLLLSITYYFLLSDVYINDIQILLIPDIPIFSTAWSIALLLVIAHVYKEGIQLREDQDLTI